jgi:hypothetical protein
MEKKIVMITGVIMFAFAVVANVQYAFSDYGVGTGSIGSFVQAQNGNDGDDTGGDSGGSGGGSCSASVTCSSGSTISCSGSTACIGFASPPNGGTPYVSCDGKKKSC